MIPEWVDRFEYPFVVHTFDHDGHRLAYVDEGEGPILLFVHGNPSWSFLYRHQIASLRKDFRCIALDHLGFGLSDKPFRADLTPQAHAKRLDAFVQHLGIQKFSIVAHDFGGPIALSWTMENADRVESLILFNTWLWSLRRNPDAMNVFRTYDSLPNRIFYSWLTASPTFLLPTLFVDARTMVRHLVEQYMCPFKEHRSRSGPYAMARDLIRCSKWFDHLWNERHHIDGIPMLLLWGDCDRMSGEHGLELFESAFPQARSVRLKDTGNFVPQGAVRRSLIEIRGFLRSLGQGTQPRLLD